MRILVTGAGGMLGRDVLGAARIAGHEPLALPRAELDLTDPVAVSAAVGAARPDAVINCAAWTAVDAAETHESEATAVNGAGAGTLAAAADAAGAWSVTVSTDYVFDGRARTPYLESAPTGPVSAYGRSKLAGEHAVAAAAPERHTIVRTAWLFGVHGGCFPRTMLRLAAERDELSVVEDQIGCPTFTGHLAPALVALAAQPLPGVVHVAAAGECSWYEFACEVIDSGREAGMIAGATTVRGIPTAQYPTPAARPAYSVLRSERGAPELPDWRAGLAEFIGSGVPA